jgi:acetyltransferase-like isoleucine patch superfamily enzyme
MTAMDNPSIRRILSDPDRSSYRKYRDLTVGDKGFSAFAAYETVSSLLGPIPGALGIVLRQKIYPGFFRNCGKGLVVGRNCTFRHPSKITLGDNVTIDDNTLIDARGADEKGLVIKDDAIISRNSIVQSKNGDIEIGKSVSIGANSTVVSWSGIRIGDGVRVAGGCYLSAGRFDFDDLTGKISESDGYSTGPIVIDQNVWIATRVTILDGVRIGQDSVISAGAVVSGNIPPRTIVSGNPAKVVFTRR